MWTDQAIHAPTGWHHDGKWIRRPTTHPRPPPGPMLTLIPLGAPRALRTWRRCWPLFFLGGDHVARTPLGRIAHTAEPPTPTGGETQPDGRVSGVRPVAAPSVPGPRQPWPVRAGHPGCRCCSSRCSTAPPSARPRDGRGWLHPQHSGGATVCWLRCQTHRPEDGGGACPGLPTPSQGEPNPTDSPVDGWVRRQRGVSPNLPSGPRSGSSSRRDPPDMAAGQILPAASRGTEVHPKWTPFGASRIHSLQERALTAAGLGLRRGKQRRGGAHASRCRRARGHSFGGGSGSSGGSTEPGCPTTSVGTCGSPSARASIEKNRPASRSLTGSVTFSRPRKPNDQTTHTESEQWRIPISRGVNVPATTAPLLAAPGSPPPSSTALHATVPGPVPRTSHPAGPAPA